MKFAQLIDSAHWFYILISKPIRGGYDARRLNNKAGLASIAFSIDAGNQNLADEVRAGSNLSRIFDNIKEFIHQSASIEPISTAVFTAILLKTVARLKQLVPFTMADNCRRCQRQCCCLRLSAGKPGWQYSQTAFF